MMRSKKGFFFHHHKLRVPSLKPRVREEILHCHKGHGFVLPEVPDLGKDQADGIEERSHSFSIAFLMIQDCVTMTRHVQQAKLK